MTRTHDLSMIINGILGGLVGITASADSVNVNSAMLIGFIAGIIIPISVAAFDKARLDDPVGATSVHLVCGIWGTIAVALFGTYDEGVGELADQLVERPIAFIRAGYSTLCFLYFCWQQYEF